MTPAPPSCAAPTPDFPLDGPTAGMPAPPAVQAESFALAMARISGASANTAGQLAGQAEQAGSLSADDPETSNTSASAGSGKSVGARASDTDEKSETAALRAAINGVLPPVMPIPDALEPCVLAPALASAEGERGRAERVMGITNGLQPQGVSDVSGFEASHEPVIPQSGKAESPLNLDSEAAHQRRLTQLVVDEQVSTERGVLTEPPAHPVPLLLGGEQSARRAGEEDNDWFRVPLSDLETGEASTGPVIPQLGKTGLPLGSNSAAVQQGCPTPFVAAEKVSPEQGTLPEPRPPTPSLSSSEGEKVPTGRGRGMTNGSGSQGAPAIPGFDALLEPSNSDRVRTPFEQAAGEAPANEPATARACASQPLEVQPTRIGPTSKVRSAVPLAAGNSRSCPATSGSIAGTDVASPEDRVKTADQATKFADVAEQKMPLVVSARLFVPTEAAGSLPIKGRTLTGGPEPKLAATKLPLPALLPGALPLPEPLDGLRAAPALDAVSGPANAAERLQARISEQVGELRHFSADSMAVIIKPDARTEIFLRLQLQGGLVDVHARFDRGDFGALNAHWGEIQQALSHQGIKLGSLETPAGVPLLQDSAALAAFGQSNPDKQSRQHRAALPEFAESSGDLALAGSAAEPLPRRHRLAAMTRSRWESWA